MYIYRNGGPHLESDMEIPAHKERLIPVYEVNACANTGEWLDEAQPTGEKVLCTDWCNREGGRCSLRQVRGARI